MANGSSATVLRSPVPTANGQNKDECLQSLAAAIKLILEDRREEGLRGVPADAVRDIVKIG